MLKVDQNSVEARPATQERFRPADFGSAGETIARGAQNLAAGIGQAGEALDKIDQTYDEAAVKQADADDLKQIIDIKSQALSSTGFDAQSAVADARKQIEEIRKARMASLKNGRQQRLYSEVFAQRNLQLEESFSDHLYKQVNAANKDAAAARADTYTSDAISSFGTPEFEKSLATAESEAANVNRGAGDAVIGLAQAKLRSHVYSSVVEGMLADPNRIQEAKQVLDEHVSEILPEDETNLRKKLNPLLEEDQTESDAGWAFTNSPVPGEPKQAPTEGPETPPRPSISGPSVAPPISKPVSPDDPTRGVGRLTNTAAQHRARGSGNALDIAAPAGTPIYPPMSGKVIKNWWSQEGGWSVLIQHPNGYITGYAHMRGQSPLREGQEVEPNTAIGGIGMTGHATGPHVHYTVRLSSAGPKVDPDKVDWGNTVNPKTVDWKEGPLTRYQADDNSLGRAMDRIYQRATAENWSQRRYQSAIERTRQIAGVQSQMYDQQQDERWNGALKTVVDLGDKFTSVSQIPNFGLLDPARQLSLQNMAKANLDGDKGDKANSPQFLEYLRQSYEERPNFIANPKYLTDPNITNGERKELYERRLQLTSDPNGQLASNMNEAVSMATRFLPKELTPDRRGAFMDRYMQAVERRQRDLGKPLEDRDKLDIARALTVETVRFTPDGKTQGYAFETLGTPGETAQVNIPQAYNRIPPGRRQEIENLLASRHLSHTPRDVVAFYLQSGR